MNRLVARIAVMLVIVLGLAAPVAASSGQDNPIAVGTTTPTSAAAGPDGSLSTGTAASPTTTSGASAPNHALDLPAMSLRPTDASLLGQPFALGRSLRFGLDFYPEADVRSEFKTDGFQVGYKNGIYRSQPDQEIWSWIVQFATPGGADKALSYWTRQAKHVTGNKTFGDRSVLLSYKTKDGNDTAAVLSLDLRLGNLFAIVEFDDFTQRTPDLATVEHLGDIFVQRIKTVAAASQPGLSTVAVRLADPSQPGVVVEHRVDAYYRVGGHDLLVGNEKDEDAQLRLASYGNATDVYEVFQGVGPDQANSDAVGFETTLLAFPDHQSASQWLNGYILATDQSGGGDMLIYDEPAGAPTFGDESLVMSYLLTDQDAFSQVGTSAWRDAGLIVLARFGTIGVIVQTHRDTTANAAEVAPLMHAQASCLDAPSECQPVPVPVALAAIVGPATGGTPTASS